MQNIAYKVQQICLCMYAPRIPHFRGVKRIRQYLKGTLDHILNLYYWHLHNLFSILTETEEYSLTHDNPLLVTTYFWVTTSPHGLQNANKLFLAQTVVDC